MPRDSDRIPAYKTPWPDSPFRVVPPPKPKYKRARPSKAQVETAAAQAKMPIKDKPIVDDDGNLLPKTLPIQEMSREVYAREVQSRSIAYKQFLKSRPLDALKLALSRNGGTKATRFLAALLDPKNQDVDIAVLAEKYRISFNDLMTVWRNDKLTEAWAYLYDGAPTVAEHTAKDAESTVACCTRCDGAGVMKVQKGDDAYEWIQCIACNGTGAIRKVGDLRSRQYVFESTGIIKAGAGVTLNLNTGAASTVESVLDEMEQVTIPVTAEVMDD